MKALFTYVLLLLLGYMVIRPALPYVEYAVRNDYIKKVLCINQDKPELSCNGKCHLAKQLKADTEEKDDLPLRSYSQDKQFSKYIPSFFYNLHSYENQEKRLFSFLNRYSFLSIHVIPHPPG